MRAPQPYRYDEEMDQTDQQDQTLNPDKAQANDNGSSTPPAPKAPAPYQPQAAVNGQPAEPKTFAQMQESGQARPPAPTNTAGRNSPEQIAADQASGIARNPGGYDDAGSTAVRGLGYAIAGQGDPYGIGSNPGDVIDPYTHRVFGNVNTAGFDPSALARVLNPDTGDARVPNGANPLDRTQFTAGGDVVGGQIAPSPLTTTPQAFTPYQGGQAVQSVQPSALPPESAVPSNVGLTPNAAPAQAFAPYTGQAAVLRQSTDGSLARTDGGGQTAAQNPTFQANSTNGMPNYSGDIPGYFGQQLNAQNPYNTDAVKSLYSWLGGNIDDQYALKEKGLRDEMARRGLSDSTGELGLTGRLADLNIQKRSAQSNMAQDLAHQFASSEGQFQQGKLPWLQSLLGYGQQGFNNDLATAQFNANQNNAYQDFLLKMLGYGTTGTA